MKIYISDICVLGKSGWNWKLKTCNDAFIRLFFRGKQLYLVSFYCDHEFAYILGLCRIRTPVGLYIEEWSELFNGGSVIQCQMHLIFREEN